MANRRFQSLDRKTQANLINCFPDLAAITSNESTGNYQQVAITVYDHWLSEEDAYKELNDISIEKQKINDAKLHSFVCSLTSNFESYLVKRVGRYKQHITFRAFTSPSAKNMALSPLPYLASSSHRFMFVIPSLKLIYVEGLDFTHHAYLKNQASIGALKAEAEKAGVYVL
jgi:hypothetical protein